MLQLARGTTAIEAVKTMLLPVLSFLSIRSSRDLILGQVEITAQASNRVGDRIWKLDESMDELFYG